MRRVPRVARPRHDYNLSKYTASRGLQGFNQLQEEVVKANSVPNQGGDVVTIGDLTNAELRIRKDIAKLRAELIATAYDEDTQTRLTSSALAEESPRLPSRTTSKEDFEDLTLAVEDVRIDKSAGVGDADDIDENHKKGAAKDPEADDDIVHTVTLNHHHSLFKWPQSLQLRSTFSLDGETEEENHKTLRDAVELIKEKGTNLFDQGATTSLFDMHWPQAATSVKEAFTILPDSVYRLLYDVTSMFVLVFELVYIPYSLTWSIDERISNVLMISTTSFWLLDMCLSFLTGYNTSDGHTEMKHRKIAVHYLKTWFPVDFVCVTGDLLNTFFALVSGSASSADGLASYLRVAKLARFLRIVSVVRSIRVVSVCNRYLESRLSESWRMMVRILELALFMVWIGHLVACFWFQIGRYGPESSTGEVWIDDPLGIGGVPIREQQPFYQYVTSYHWGLAQITLGAHDVNPVNPWERVFVISINLFGLLFGGTLVSVLSTTLIDLREMNQEKIRTLRDLKTFLLQNDVLVGIRMRCFVQVNERLWQRESILVEKDVTALDLLSVGLCRELRHDLYSKYLLKHPLLITWSSVSEHSIVELCSDPQGLEFVLLLTDDELFTPGTPARGAYCILEGSIEYTLDKRNVLSWAGEHAQMAEAGQWMSEAAWWCTWTHVGTAQTANHVPCKLLCLTPENISRVMMRSRSIEALTKLYANAFYRCTIKASADFLPTDLKVHYTGFGDLVFAMPNDAQILVGYAAVRTVLDISRLAWVSSTMPWGGAVNVPGLQLLMDEVWNGKATVVMDGLKSLQRHVSLVILALQNEDNVLVELADYDSGEESMTQIHSQPESHHQTARGPKWKSACRLPAVKQMYGELPHEAVQRLIANRFAQLQPVLATTHPKEVVLTVELEPSQKFGVDTKYSKARCVVPCGSDGLALLDNSSVIVDMSTMSSKLTQRTKSMTSVLDYTGSLFTSTCRMPSTLYVLSGSAHAGVYAWMTMEDLKEVNANKRFKEDVLLLIQSQVPLPDELQQMYGVAALPCSMNCMDL